MLNNLELAIVEGNYNLVLSSINNVPKTIEEALLMIEAYLGIGKIANALELLEKLRIGNLETYQAGYWYLLQAKYFFEKGEIKNGFNMLVEGRKKHLEDIENPILRIRFELEFIKGLFNLGELDTAEKITRATIDELEKEQSSEFHIYLAEAYHQLANINYEDGELKIAGAFYQKALQLRKSVGNKREIADSLNNLGIIYHEEKKSKKALAFHEEALELRKQVGHPGLIGTSLNNIANIYHAQMNRTVAKELHDEALESFKKVGNQLDIAMIMHNIGTYHRKGVSIFRPSFGNIMLDKLS